MLLVIGGRCLLFELRPPSLWSPLRDRLIPITPIWCGVGNVVVVAAAALLLWFSNCEVIIALFVVVVAEEVGFVVDNVVAPADAGVEEE